MKPFQGVVTGITQDLQGNIWFACGGLYQFDGVHVKLYIHDPLNPGSVAINYVECVFADKMEISGQVLMETVLKNLIRKPAFYTLQTS